MNTRYFAIGCALLCVTSISSAQSVLTPTYKIPTTIEGSGLPLSEKNFRAVPQIALSGLQDLGSELPTAQLANVAQRKLSDVRAGSRSAKDAEIYRNASPSVVLIMTKDGLGSGSLIGASGLIITNAHVVKGYSTVAVVFKPAVEGTEPTRDDIKLGTVVKSDETSDLALVQATEVPKGRSPLRLGDISEIAVGADVRAIGHPEGESWSFTKGVISQYRIGFEWGPKNDRHKADVIQTQTPINPGNSGGPLIGDSGALIGVNSFKGKDTEGLNFAVSVDDVKRFLAHSDSKRGHKKTAIENKKTCELKELSRFRNKGNDATVIAYDTNCAGKVNADYIIPDNKAKPIMYIVDRNGDGRPDVIFFDLKQQKKWDISFWDEKFEGRWTLVGYHPDGKMQPSSFESYETFEKRRQAER